MSCTKHPTDLSSTVGVCASCLRERLFEFMVVQAQAQHNQHQQAQLTQKAHSRASAAESHRKSDSEPPPLLFPCSVSPYVTRRKSYHTTTTNLDNHFDVRFYSTPQVGPGYNTVNGVTTSITTSRSFSKFARFPLLCRIFRSRSEDIKTDPNQNSDAGDSCSASSSSPSWFANIFSATRKKKSRFPMVDASCTGCHRPRRRADRGMLPVEGLETVCENSDHRPSGSGNSDESSQVPKTPVGGPSVARRGKPGQGRNVSTGLVFCLRASPSRQGNQKGGLPPV
ncbi:hypothetical protein HS088_TW18G00253 [Tripterygium wilfordii]|uniref:Uncharacterized protein n=1 Tax=Tripterygium wilfordii TaxID=458696 RepID=A0A7J7CBQ9_TRIWF|nr:hypothetical protein HS088_TW18G00253 [Tripterygium wilfordii]